MAEPKRTAVPQSGPNPFDTIVDWLRDNKIIPQHAYPTVGRPQNAQDPLAPGRVPIGGAGMETADDASVDFMRRVSQVQGYKPNTTRQSDMVEDRRPKNLSDYINNLMVQGFKPNFGRGTDPMEAARFEGNMQAELGNAMRFEKYQNEGRGRPPLPPNYDSGMGFAQTTAPRGRTEPVATPTLDRATGGWITKEEPRIVPLPEPRTPPVMRGSSNPFEGLSPR